MVLVTHRMWNQCILPGMWPGSLPLDEVYSLDGYLIHAEGTCLADYFHLTPVEARDAWGI